jgi:hypothetical protein
MKMMVYQLSPNQIGYLWGMFFWTNAPDGRHVTIEKIAITEKCDLLLEYIIHYNGQIKTESIPYDYEPPIPKIDH